MTNPDSAMTKCEDGVVTTVTNCGSYLIGECTAGCRIPYTFGYDVAATLCKDGLVKGDGGAETGGGGQGGGGSAGNGVPEGCAAPTDNVSTVCRDGVLTTTVVCPYDMHISGSCPFGCRYQGIFGFAMEAAELCNPPPDGGSCDGDAACGDASQSQ
jgi:hypothetical protein